MWHFWQVIAGWLSRWGNLILTAVIALAAGAQGLFAKRLLALQKQIEADQNRVNVVTKMSVENGSLGFTVANLCRFGIWFDRIDIGMGTRIEYVTVGLPLQSNTAHWVNLEDKFFSMAGDSRQNVVSEKLSLVARYDANEKTYASDPVKAAVSVRDINSARVWRIELE